MKIGIAAFCKTIGKSDVKTRLANEIGIKYAEEFYRQSVACIESLLTKVSDDRVTCFWAVGEEEELDNPCWGSHKTIWTGKGGLGERLWHVTESLLQNHDAVVIIGTDSPQMTLYTLKSAIEILKKEEQVFGPSVDGGFYLYGSRVSVAKDIWIGVEYSQNDTAVQFKKALKQKGMIPKDLLPLHDVDRKEDLKDLSKVLETLGKERIRQQEQLQTWIKNNWG